MKRLFNVLAVSSLLIAGSAFAAEHMHAAAAKSAKPKTVTLKGEIVDTGCYMGAGKHGEAHKECATKCAADGMPIALLTSGGKLYLLAPNHDNADPFAKAKELAGSTVEVSGTLMEKGGMSAIDLESVKPASVAAK